ncbi:MAG: DUF5698 domain-containing protein [Eubacteriales bacterium]
MDFFTNDSAWVYLAIFFGKNIEVTFATLRIVLINRGERLKGSIVAFFEVLLWLMVTGSVLVGLSDWRRILVFAIAFASGSYLGSWLESKLAFGLCSIQVISPRSKPAEALVKNLRDHDFAVTVVAGEGKMNRRSVMLLHLKRRRIPEAVEIIKSSNINNLMITINDTKVIRGGYIKK